MLPTYVEGQSVCTCIHSLSLLAAAAVQWTCSGNPSGEGFAFNNFLYIDVAYPMSSDKVSAHASRHAQLIHTSRQWHTCGYSIQVANYIHAQLLHTSRQWHTCAVVTYKSSITYMCSYYIQVASDIHGVLHTSRQLHTCAVNTCKVLTHVECCFASFVPDAPTAQRCWVISWVCLHRQRSQGWADVQNLHCMDRAVSHTARTPP